MAVLTRLNFPRALAFHRFAVGVRIRLNSGGDVARTKIVELISAVTAVVERTAEQADDVSERVAGHAIDPIDAPQLRKIDGTAAGAIHVMLQELEKDSIGAVVGVATAAFETSLVEDSFVSRTMTPGDNGPALFTTLHGRWLRFSLRLQQMLRFEK